MIEALPVLIFALQSFFAFYLIISCAFISFSLATKSIGSGSRPFVWCGACIIGMWLAITGFHILAWAGFYNTAAAVVGISLINIGFHLRGFRAAETLNEVVKDIYSFLRFAAIEQNVFVRLFNFFVIGASIFLLARVLSLPPLSSDGTVYHAVKSAMWVQSGSIFLMESPGWWSSFRLYPGGGEALVSWGMLSFHGDFFACTVEWVQWIFIMITAHCIGLSIGLKSRHAFAGAVYAGFIPALKCLVGSGFVENVMALSVLLSFLFALLFFQKKKMEYLIFALGAAGVACSIKIVALPMVLCIFVLGIIFLVKKKISISSHLLCILAIVFLLPSAPWYIHTAIESGYPLSPVSTKIFGVTLGQANPVMEWFQDRPGLNPYDFNQEFAVLKDMFRYPFIFGFPDFGVFGLIPLVIFVFAVPLLIRESPWTGALFLSVFIAQVLLFYLPDFSVVRIIWQATATRFLFTAAILSAVGSMVFLKNDRLRFYYYALMLTVMISTLFEHYAGIGQGMAEKKFVYSHFAGIVCLMLITVRLKPKIYGWKGIVSVICFFICVTGIININKKALKNSALHESYFFAVYKNYWAPAIAHIDTPEFERRIAVTGGPWQDSGSWNMYYFMGSEFQNTLFYIPISKTGEFIHFSKENNRIKKGDFESWKKRLIKNRITEVYSFYPYSIEFVWMLKHREMFEPLSILKQGGGLFRIKLPIDEQNSGRKMQ